MQPRIGPLLVEDPWMKLVGGFSGRALVNALARSGSSVLVHTIQHVMTSPILSCQSSDRIDAALAMMTLARIRHLPVVDENGLRGIVSIGDLIKNRLEEKQLEASVLLDLMRLHA
jgi:CBS domain-containing protein